VLFSTPQQTAANAGDCQSASSSETIFYPKTAAWNSRTAATASAAATTRSISG